MLVASESPLGEVGVIDEFGLEALAEEGLDLGKAVEPGEDGVGGLTLGEAAVDLVADELRERGDFTVARHGKEG